MSIIGPRPLLVSYLPWYTEEEKQRHTVVGFAAQLIVILLNYINRTIFIYYLGAEYLGLDLLLQKQSESDLVVGSNLVSKRERRLCIAQSDGKFGS